jgi:hypothetical protein
VCTRIKRLARDREHLDASSGWERVCRANLVARCSDDFNPPVRSRHDIQVSTGSALHHCNVTAIKRRPPEAGEQVVLATVLAERSAILSVEDDEMIVTPIVPHQHAIGR